MIPTAAPPWWSAMARLTATVDLPTPPLPDETAIVCRTSGMRSAARGGGWPGAGGGGPPRGGPPAPPPRPPPFRPAGPPPGEPRGHGVHRRPGLRRLGRERER